MIRTLATVVLASIVLAGCSGSIYRQKTVTGQAPVVITTDARQRLSFSQMDPKKASSVGSDPVFRRFCSESSPDVFTVLGVSGSGSGTLGVAADKSVNAALQAAFSSSETGTTIARTQTINMLREMMYRTCERYLSGAVSSEEFPIIAARDQRIMVSILAIEQLTGAITPRTTSIVASGAATTGLDPSAMVKILSSSQAELKGVEEELALLTKKLADADVPPGTCATIKKKKADGTPALTADETAKFKACDDAETKVADAKVKRDRAQSAYDDLVRASKTGIGVSSANTIGSAQVASAVEREATVEAVAKVVQNIVGSTFSQDETQLFCIRSLNDSGSKVEASLRDECLRYLVARVQTDRNRLANTYGLDLGAVDQAVTAGAEIEVRRSRASTLIPSCLAAGQGDALGKALQKDPTISQLADPLLAAAGRGSDAVDKVLSRMSETEEITVIAIAGQICRNGGA